jgi:hypothetical protein
VVIAAALILTNCQRIPALEELDPVEGTDRHRDAPIVLVGTILSTIPLGRPRRFRNAAEGFTQLRKTTVRVENVLAGMNVVPSCSSISTAQLWLAVGWDRHQCA